MSTGATEPRNQHHERCAVWTTHRDPCDCRDTPNHEAHDLRCPELRYPRSSPQPQRCTCRDQQGHRRCAA